MDIEAVFKIKYDFYQNCLASIWKLFMVEIPVFSEHIYFDRDIERKYNVNQQEF
jgi:hypothetical protein